MSDDEELMQEEMHPDIERLIRGEDIGNGGFQRVIAIQLKTIYGRQKHVIMYAGQCKEKRIQEIQALRDDMVRFMHEIELKIQRLAITNGILKVLAGVGLTGVVGFFVWLGKYIVSQIGKGVSP